MENRKGPNKFDMLRHKAERFAANGKYVGGDTEVFENTAYASRTEKDEDGQLYRVTQVFHRNELGVVVSGQKVRVKIS